MPDAPVPECPICGKPPGGPRLRPFCSSRCKEVDLGRWLTGSYVIPGAASDPDDEGDANPLDPRPEPG